MDIPQDSRDLMHALAADPARGALLLDFDGTLAPIVSRPEDARLLPGAARVIADLRDRLGLVAFISGRGLDDLRQRVGIPGLAYAGNHGMELQHLEGPSRLAEGVAPWRTALDEFAAQQTTDAGAVVGVEIEDKGATLSVHWRNAADHDAAEAWLRDVRTPAAVARGLAVTWGRMVMEVRPPVAVDKGTAARELVQAAGARVAVHIGDDRTDADAWAALHELQREGSLTCGAGVIAAAVDAPPDLLAQADARVDGPSGALGLIGYLRDQLDRA